jgi:hypothetical protein
MLHEVIHHLNHALLDGACVSARKVKRPLLTPKSQAIVHLMCMHWVHKKEFKKKAGNP